MSDGVTLTSEQIEAELQRIAAETLNDSAMALATGVQPFASSDPEESGESLARFLASDWRQALVEGDNRLAAPYADDILARVAPTLSREDVRYRELCRGILHTFAQVLDVEARRLAGDPYAAVRLPLNPTLIPPFAGAVTPSQRPAAPKGTPKMSEVLPEVFARYKDGWTGQTRSQNATTYRLFLQIMGDRPFTAYTRKDLSEFYQKLRRLPASYGRSPRQRDWTYAQIVAEADRVDAPRITSKTVGRHGSAMGQLFGFLKERGDYVDNPAYGHGLNTARAKRTKRRKCWEGDKLVKLFTSPVWTGCKSERFRTIAGSVILRDALYFLPLISLHNGGRLEELAKLRRRHIRQEAGQWYLELLWEGDERLKNEQSERIVPLHSALIAYGFIRHVECVATNPDDFVFPELKPGGADDKRGHGFSKDFSYYRSRIGVRERGLDFHSFRTTFINRLYAAGVSEKTIQDLVGHEGKTTLQRNYLNLKDLPLLTTAVEKVRYPELDGLEFLRS